jgi:hypothetical protein
VRQTRLRGPPPGSLVEATSGSGDNPMSDIKRRAFITLLGGAAAAWPLAARAQQADKLPTIGYSGGGTPSTDSQRVAAFVQRLRELGWTEGRNVAIEYRWPEGRSDRVAEIALELVRIKVDVIVTTGTPGALAAKQATLGLPWASLFFGGGCQQTANRVRCFRRPPENWRQLRKNKGVACHATTP